MLIVLEGVDGAGKTHLKDRLAMKHGARTRMLHSAQLHEDPMIAYEWSLRDYDRRDLTALWVLDRWHVGELVYGPLYRGRSLLTEPAAKHVELFLESLGALRVVVTDSIGVVQDRLRDRGESFLRPEHVGLVWDFYADYAQRVPGWRTVTSTKVYPKQLIDLARSAQMSQLKIATMPSYVGSLNPRFIVLSGHRPQHPNMPAFRAALTPTMSSPRNHAILERLMPYEDFGVLSQDGDQIKDAWALFGRPPVIATDPEAYAACAIAGIEATPIKSALSIMEGAHV